MEKDIDIDKIIKQIYDEKITEGNIPEEIYGQVAKGLNKQVVTGYSTRYDLEDAKMLLQLHNNVAVFSAFKTYRQTGEMAVNLFRKDGSKKPFNEFLKESRDIDKKYRSNWLKSEYDMAQKQARSAERWQQFLRDKDVYPNLIYKASSSAEPRLDHQKYYGIIKPIEDAFWNTGMPPLAWGCKCSVEQTDIGASAGTVDAPERIKGVSGNAGKTGLIFTANHSYISGLSKEEKASIKTDLQHLQKSFDTTTFKINGKKAKVEVSFNADIEDLGNNFSSAKLITDNIKLNVKIRHHSDVPGIKNPEFEIKGIKGDKASWDKATTSGKYVDGVFKDKIKRKNPQLKGDSFLLFDFDGKITSDNYLDACNRLFGNLNIRKQVQFVLLENKGKILKIDNNKTLTKQKIIDKIKRDLL